MIVSLASFAVVGFGLLVFGERLHRWAFLVAAVVPATTLVWVCTQLPQVTDGTPPSEQFRWVRALGLSVELRLDGLAATMSLVVCSVGVLVFLYAAHYFAADAGDLGRLAGLLVLFAGSMLLLVQADQVIVLYTGWELTTIASFLLIGNRHVEPRARAAALHALLVTSAGGLAMLGGLVVLGRESGTFVLSEMVGTPIAGGVATTVAMVLLLVGAFTKSAQYPFHAWLPGAMAAPTPVSAYLHSATMVTAGVFLVARFAPMFASADLWRPLVFITGCATLIFGGLRALRQHDLKLLLAFGTVSQLGLLIILFGAGTPSTAAAGWALLVAHAAFKAALFMVVGIIDHQTGTRDIRRLPGLRTGWLLLEIVTVLAAASMAGVPLDAGFVAKEQAYDSLSDATFQGSTSVLIATVLGSMLTVAYTVRFYAGAFIGPRRRTRGAGALSPTPPSVRFVVPAAVLAAFGVLIGILPGILDPLATASLAAFGPEVPPVHLSLWHGPGPLVLSLITLAGGALLVLGDHRLQRLLAEGGRLPSGAEVYRATLRGLGVVSARVTAFVQNGSLPIYAGVIVATAAVAPGAALLVAGDWPGWPPSSGLDEAPVAIALVVAALGAAIVRERFSAALFLGVCGYAMAGLFVLSGAPDLALTQAAVETLSTVVFVLVLRRLPERFERQSSAGRRVVRLVIATAVGITVFGFALVAAGYRLEPPVSDEMVARSVPDGHGSNVVNVILVDFRGFDTLGEITVLAVASIGAVALTRVGRRAADVQRGSRRLSAAVRRLPFVDVSIRVVFPVVMTMSLWLLFAGHNQPGGGFVGGLLAGAAITLRYVAGGVDEVRDHARFRPWTVLGIGLLITSVTAMIPLLLGGSVLEVGYVSLDLPVLREVALSSALVFDTGVYLAVVGMVLMVFEAFGDDPVMVPP
jgi:multicomponent Na+:H+ antiporter subunit A